MKCHIFDDISFVFHASFLESSVNRSCVNRPENTKHEKEKINNGQRTRSSEQQISDLENQ